MNKINIMNMFFYLFILILIIFIILLNHFFEIVKVNGISMMNTYETSELLHINKISKNYNKNDVIVYKYTSNMNKFSFELTSINKDFLIQDTYNLKRVVGVPGDNILITNEGELYVNGIYECSFTYEYFSQNYQLEISQYFVLGDNIENSLDSRIHGPVHYDDIIGKVLEQRNK